MIASPAPLRVESACDLGPLFTDNSHRLIGQDGAFSIPLGNESLWFFGDTLIGQRRPHESMWFPGGQPVGAQDMSGRNGIDRMINNSGLLVPAGEGPQVLRRYRYICDESGAVRCLLPLEKDEHRDRDRIWCQHGVQVLEKLFLSFIKVRMLDGPIGPLPVGFEIVGSGLAVGSPRDWNFRRVEHSGDSILWPAHRPHFGVAFLYDPEDGWLYVYGTCQREGVHQCFLARVRPSDIENLDAYEYFSSPAPAWSRNVEDAIPIFDRMPSELSVSFNAHLMRYVAVHSLELTGKIVARAAPEPWGPWSEPVELWNVRVKHDYPIPYSPLIYAGKEHPELSAEAGRRIYLTYIEFEEYFPHLIEVTLA